VQPWLTDIANQRLHGTTGAIPSQRLIEEQTTLQPLPPVWRGDIAAARPQVMADAAPSPQPSGTPRPANVLAHIEASQPAQHPLAIYAQLLDTLRTPREVAP
jgi:hypothetical protein